VLWEYVYVVHCPIEEKVDEFSKTQRYREIKGLSIPHDAESFVDPVDPELVYLCSHTPIPFATIAGRNVDLEV
jgi:hypothetical protein